ncbi:hypothetical protein Sjap_014509 [Stephania japonica]|uniref:Uncharacterized protein n=1 Tax=Stephania japonica TaxID=461633 RepID=A0AAP0IJA6_9MAGN
MSAVRQCEREEESVWEIERGSSDGKRRQQRRQTQAAVEESYCDEFYENIQAPMFFDFTHPEPPLLDEDRSWFCVSLGCDQQHEEINPDALFESFRLQVLKARRPDLLLPKVQSIANPKANVPIIPKPFRLRTDERATLREANLEKKHGIALLKEIGKSETRNVKEAAKAYGKTIKGSSASAFHGKKYKKLIPTIPKPFRLRTDVLEAARFLRVSKASALSMSSMPCSDSDITSLAHPCFAPRDVDKLGSRDKHRRLMCRGVQLANGSGSEGPRLAFANSVWIEKSLPIKPSFKEVVRNVYKVLAKKSGDVKELRIGVKVRLHLRLLLWFSPPSSLVFSGFIL